MHPGLPFILRWLYQVWHKLMYYRLDELVRGGIDVCPRLGSATLVCGEPTEAYSSSMIPVKWKALE